jgi:hypothetical protein
VVCDRLISNCQKALAAEIFQFLAFALLAALVFLGYVIKRKGGPSQVRGGIIA